MFPIEQVRERFPALNREDNGKKVIYFDGPGGTQMVDHAMEYMYRYIRNGMANLHGTFNTSADTDALLDKARETVADLLGCQANEVAFGANMTTHAFAIARSLAGFLKEGDEIVVTELDHRANVDPWVTLARDCGATIKFIKLNPETFTLRLEDLHEIITDKTKLVAAGMSSNVTGTVTDLQPIIERAKEVGALAVVDAVHGVPHLSIDVQELECDILLCSAYKFFGPHVGIAVVRESLFEKLPVYKLKPAPAEIPYKLETGTQNHEGIAGLMGAIRFIEELGYGETRRERLVTGMHAIDDHETELAAEVESFLRSLPEVTLYRAASGRRTPTFAFTIEGHRSRDVTAWLSENYNMCVADGDFYASTMAEVLNVYPTGGWVRIGLAPYNTLEEIQQLKEALAAYILQHQQNVV
ncbi:cysteine desulfurase-like protein [Mesobacillus selenatarsenatis]|uniref:Cysteine desulfurase-like protein n=1 Tax=Mesobacillus selenatarsenatis TaxID=388741 RepID=A0A846TAR9_9BACI|nr:cysteine desulfurase-like protein [Mesobacillus selenatarsenatis]NKE03919.1 cysteine desulfurase-like protein [Mesobacillus selenatarsenatis]